MPVAFITLENAISRYLNNSDEVAQLHAAVDLMPVKVIKEFSAGLQWESGEDIIDSQAFQYGREIAENYSGEIIWKLVTIL